jgi:hypothetical protein
VQREHNAEIVIFASLFYHTEKLHREALNIRNLHSLNQKICMAQTSSNQVMPISAGKCFHNPFSRDFLWVFFYTLGKSNDDRWGPGFSLVLDRFLGDRYRDRVLTPGFTEYIRGAFSRLSSKSIPQATPHPCFAPKSIGGERNERSAFQDTHMPSSQISKIHEEFPLVSIYIRYPSLSRISRVWNRIFFPSK